MANRKTQKKRAKREAARKASAAPVATVTQVGSAIVFVNCAVPDGVQEVFAGHGGRVEVRGASTHVNFPTATIARQVFNAMMNATPLYEAFVEALPEGTEWRNDIGAALA